MDELTEKEWVVCVNEDYQHIPISVLRLCDKCHASVWCHPRHLLRIPLCLNCFKKLDHKDIQIQVLPEDIKDGEDFLNNPPD